MYPLPQFFPWAAVPPPPPPPRFRRASKHPPFPPITDYRTVLISGQSIGTSPSPCLEYKQCPPSFSLAWRRLNIKRKISKTMRGSPPNYCCDLHFFRVHSRAVGSHGWYPEKRGRAEAQVLVDSCSCFPLAGHDEDSDRCGGGVSI